MQPLTSPPRDSLTAAQVTTLLQDAAGVTVDYGADLLDSSNVLLDDLSPDLSGGEVDRDCYATVHGTCKLSLSRALTWGRDRVRPWMTLNAGAVSARWNLGVYILTSPDTPVGETPQTWSATGYDLLYLLGQQITDAMQYAKGANVLTSVQAAVTAAGVASPVLLDGTASAKTLAADMTFIPTSSSVPTYLDVINALLKAVAYRGMWADQDGNLRSEPYLAPALRAPEWTFTADDVFTSLLGVSRTVSQDLWPVPNWWRFVQQGLTTAPSEGAGQYTVTTADTDPTSAASLGYTKAKWSWLNAADQASLQAQGDAVVATDRQVTKTYQATVSPFPAFGHMDVYQVTDTAAGGPLKVLNHQWTLPLDGTDATVTLDVIA